MPISCKPTLQATPLQSLVDEEIRISITHLLPGQRIRCHAEATDISGQKWRSQADFLANDQGKVSLQTDASLSGTYSGVDAMGLFWSMLPEKKDSAVFASKSLEPVSVTLSLEINGQIVAIETLKRLKCASDLKRQIIRESGVIGTLFTPKKEGPLPAVLFIGGSEGGLREGRAALLASHGFITLALAYFGMEDLPKRLENIPLEYFSNAIDWLRNHPQVQGRPIAIHGSSRGAELALLLSSLFPDKISAVAAITPSSAMWGKAWSLNGELLPSCSPQEMLSETSPSIKGNMPKPISLTPIFLEWIQRDDFEPAQIPVEKMKAPLLIVSGGEDEMWPATYFANRIMKRLDDFQSKIDRKHLHYPHAGHYFSAPYYPTACQKIFHHYSQMWLNFGGRAFEHAQACKDGWIQTIAFFKTIHK